MSSFVELNTPLFSPQLSLFWFRIGYRTASHDLVGIKRWVFVTQVALSW